MSSKAWLFVPGDSGRKIEKAFGTAAQVIILDLEDGVAPAAKSQARDTILTTWGSLPQETRDAKKVVLRCNAVGSPEFSADLDLARTLAIDTLMVPKCEGARDVEAVLRVLPEVTIVPLIESARGVVRLEEIVRAAKNIRRVAFGAVDFALDLDVDWTREGDERRFAMGQLVLLSRALDLDPPLGAVFPVTDDRDAFLADVRREKRLGFSGKMTIHPRQIEWYFEANHMTPEERAWSRKAVEAFEAAGSGAIQVDGRLVDLPVYLNARRRLRWQASDGPK